MEKYLEELVKITKQNTIYTGMGALFGLVAIVISIVALFISLK
jgi:hypothetical protein